MTASRDPVLIDVPLRSEFAGDPDMRELIELFINEMPEKIRSLETLWQGRQLEPLKRIAHQLKGACGGYGYPTVSTAAGSLEAAVQTALAAPAPEAELQKIQAGVNDLIRLCRRVQANTPSR